jgi:hypothetical protein
MMEFSTKDKVGFCEYQPHVTSK